MSRVLYVPRNACAIIEEKLTNVIEDGRVNE